MFSQDKEFVMNLGCQIPIIASVQALVIWLKTSVNGWISGLKLTDLWAQQLPDAATDLNISYHFIREGVNVLNGDHLI